jgi:hypothetical protein
MLMGLRWREPAVGLRGDQSRMRFACESSTWCFFHIYFEEHVLDLVSLDHGRYGVNSLWSLGSVEKPKSSQIGG